MNEIEIFKSAGAAQGAWWSWTVAAYLFLGGVSAGLMVLAGLRRIVRPDEADSERFRWLLWLAPAILTLGMLALWLDLGRKWNAGRFYLALRPSAPMSWGAWILLAVYPASVLFALAGLPLEIRRRLGRAPFGARIARLAERLAEDSARRRLAWANVAVGVALGVYTGILLGTFSARPLWHSAVLGPLFLVSGLSTAAALLLLLGLSPSERHSLTKIDAGMLGLELSLLGLLLAGLSTGNEAQRGAAHLLLGGAFTPVFWSFVVIAGAAVPLAAEAWEIAGRRASRWVAPALVLAGGFALRWILVFAGQSGPWGLH